MKDDVLADAIDVFSDHRIVNELCFFLDLGGQLAPQFHFLFRAACHSSPDTLIDVALSNHCGIFVRRQLLVAGRLGRRRG